MSLQEEKEKQQALEENPHQKERLELEEHFMDTLAEDFREGRSQEPDVDALSSLLRPCNG